MQDDTKFEGQEQADRAFRANASPRFRRLSEFERWVLGRQYDDLPSFWSDEKPLWDRAPCVVYPIVAIAVSGYGDLLFGEGRFPKFSSKPGEDEADEDDGLGPDDSDVLDRFVAAWHRESQFRAVSREAVESAMGQASVAVIHGVRDSLPFADIVPAKWCEPKLDASGNVLSLEIQYPYQEQYKNPQNGKWAVRTRLYRRTIDDKRDIEYPPGEANEQGVEPAWQQNTDRSVEHGFGFCPVVWYPFMRGCVPVNEIDGKPIQSNVTDEIRAHDIARSQWHRGALMSEPQPYEINVPPGFSPTEQGVTARVGTTERGAQPSPTNPVTGAFVDRLGGDAKPARKRGPGYVWQYPDKAEVGVLPYPGEALKAQEENCRDLRMKLMEMLAVVLLDPESFKALSTMSGRALQALKQKQLDHCDKIREDLESRYFQKSIALQLRIARAVLQKNGKLRVAGAKKVKAILAATPDGAEPWQPPRLHLRWGEYLKPDPEEQSQIVLMCTTALASKVPFLTVRAVVEKVAAIFGIENVEAFLDELKKETDANDAKKSADAAAEMQAAMKQLQKPKADGSSGTAADPTGAPAAGKPGSGAERPGAAPPAGKV